MTPSCAASSWRPPAASTEGRPTAGRVGLRPFEVLFDSRSGRLLALPPTLRHIYGGDAHMGPRALYANFVASIDGVVAVENAPSSGSLISGKSQSDRFLMGLLRALADAVLVGAGTLRATPGHQWTAPHVFPSLADEFEVLRHTMHRPADPRLVVLI